MHPLICSGCGATNRRIGRAPDADGGQMPAVAYCEGCRSVVLHWLAPQHRPAA